MTPCRSLTCFFIPVLFTGVACGEDEAVDASEPAPADQVASTLFDLSGLAWLGDGQFLAVHDAKDPDELERPRVSLLTFPQGPEGLMWKEAVIDWPTDLGPSSDLESASTIPGTQEVLFAESGDDAHEDPAFQRIFLASVDGDEVVLINHTVWPDPVFNVEANAVAAFEGGFVFAYAERAEGEPTTDIRWTSFEPDTLTFGAFSSVEFSNPDPDVANRPIVGMDFDPEGNLYIVAAFDPDVDTGPYTSSIWKIAALTSGTDGAEIALFDTPERIATADGFKIESVVVDDMGHVYFGTDDEDLGNVLRPLP